MHFILLLLYDVGVKIYFTTIFFASFFNEKARKWMEGRKNIFENIKNKISKLQTPNSKLIWFHCSSLGEFEQGRPLIEKCRMQHAAHRIVLTFFSPSGYEIRKNYSGADAVFYLPIDSKANAEKFISLIKPHLAVFVKYEFWHHYLHELKNKNIPSILISAKFREHQVFFKWYGLFFRNMLKTFSKIFVQDEKSLSLLNSVEIKNASLAYDTRFDRVMEVSREAKRNLIIEKFKDGKNILIGGSTWKEEEKIIADCEFKIANLKFIIAPHEINENHIRSILQQFSESKIIRYSQANEKNVQDKSILLIDSIGMLSSIYQYGKYALVGGGFGKGIHNILEPAVFGLPVFIGHNYSKFEEAEELIKLKGVFPISEAGYLIKNILSLEKDENEYRKTAEICKSFVHSKSGGTNTILEYLSSSKIFSSVTP